MSCYLFSLASSSSEHTESGIGIVDTADNHPQSFLPFDPDTCPCKSILIQIESNRKSSKMAVILEITVFLKILCKIYLSQVRKVYNLILMQPSLHKALIHFRWTLQYQSNHQTRLGIHLLLLWYLNLHKEWKSSSSRTLHFLRFVLSSHQEPIITNTAIWPIHHVPSALELMAQICLYTHILKSG